MRDIVRYIGEGFFKNIHADVDSMIEDLFTRIQRSQGSQGSNKLQIFINSRVVNGWPGYISSFDQKSGILTMKQSRVSIDIDIKKDWDACWSKIYNEVVKIGSKGIIARILPKANNKNVLDYMYFWVYDIHNQSGDQDRYKYNIVRNKPMFDEIKRF